MQKRYRNSTIHTSPNMLMKKMRSLFPVAGPSAENTNIRKLDRNRFDVFLLIQTNTPMIIIGITVPKDSTMLIASAHTAVVSLKRRRLYHLPGALLAVDIISGPWHLKARKLYCKTTKLMCESFKSKS